MPTAQRKQARQAIARMLQAAANPSLTDAQAKTLLNEARENAELVFGPWAIEELSRIVIEQVAEFYESRILVLEELARSAGLTVEQLDSGSQE